MKIKQNPTKLNDLFFVSGDLFDSRYILDHMKTNNKTFCFIMGNDAGTTIAFFETIYMLEKCTSGISKSAEKVKIMLDPVDVELHEIEVIEC